MWSMHSAGIDDYFSTPVGLSSLDAVLARWRSRSSVVHHETSITIPSKDGKQGGLETARKSADKGQRKSIDKKNKAADGMMDKARGRRKVDPSLKESAPPPVSFKL